MCLNGLFIFLSASRRLKVPMMLLSSNGLGSAMLLSTCVSAAKFMTAPQPSRKPSRARGFDISALMKWYLSSSLRS
jgi:hypothetical protein